LFILWKSLNRSILFPNNFRLGSSECQSKHSDFPKTNLSYLLPTVLRLVTFCYWWNKLFNSNIWKYFLVKWSFEIRLANWFYIVIVLIYVFVPTKVFWRFRKISLLDSTFSSRSSKENKHGNIHLHLPTSK
jgi:hypothetical protein